MPLITIRSFNNVMEAHMAKAKLELEGIECYLFDEHMATANPLSMQAIGGVKLKVDEEQLGEAAAILNADAHEPFTDEAGQRITCPNCHSDQLTSRVSFTRGVLSIFSWLTVLFVGGLPLHSRYVYRCKKCKHEFERKKADF